jgi:hypothetical protein
MVSVGFDRVRAMVESHEPRSAAPCAVRQVCVVTELLHGGRGPVEEHPVDLIPIEMPLDIGGDVASGTQTVISVNVPAHRDSGGANPLHRGGDHHVGLTAGPVRQVEYDQPDLLCVLS